NVENIGVERRKVVRRLEYALEEYRNGWEKSLKDTVRITQKEDNYGNKHSKTTQTVSGDSKMLDGFVETAIQIANYQGVSKEDMVKKYEVTILPKLPEELFGQFGLGQQEIRHEDITE